MTSSRSPSWECGAVTPDLNLVSLSIMLGCISGWHVWFSQASVTGQAFESRCPLVSPEKTEGTADGRSPSKVCV